MSAKTQPQTIYVCDNCHEPILEGQGVILVSGRTVRFGKLAPGEADLTNPDRHYHYATLLRSCWRRPEDYR